MKLLSSIVALAVFGKVVPALAVCALCRLAQNSLSDFFFQFIQKLCCPPTLGNWKLVSRSPASGGGIDCSYGNGVVTTGNCYYVSTLVSYEMANVLPSR